MDILGTCGDSVEPGLERVKMGDGQINTRDIYSNLSKGEMRT